MIKIKIKILGYFIMVLLTTLVVINIIYDKVMYSEKMDILDLLSSIGLFIIFSDLMIKNIKILKNNYENNKN